MIKTLAVISLALFILLSIIVPRYLGPDDISSCKVVEDGGTCGSVDAIIAVSGGDTSARVDEAVKLYNDGWSDILIFSGAAADPDSPSNAESMKKRAISAGIPSGDILIEEFSRTTEENAKNTGEFISRRGLRKVILVTSAYHQRRASLEFGLALGDSVNIVNHPVSTDSQWSGTTWWLHPTGWWLAGSEIIKITAFYLSFAVSKL